ncbi:MAG TPA: T9SS type A sorting domain-containing protein, partial [Bacteroidia bacterium]|nr:T9SS type A sorting domain-containing protein [Bacteroidia bacterium]
SAKTQCSIIEVPLAQRTSAADLIVEGKVTAKNSYWNVQHNMIYTANTIELYKIFKGSVSTTSIDVITEGGTVGYDRISVDPSLDLEVGDIGVFTCETPHHIKGTLNSQSGLPMYEPYASVQGFLKYDLDASTASDPFHTYSNIEADVYDVVGNGHHYTSVSNFDIHSYAHNGNPNTASVTITSFSPTTITGGTGTTLTINGSGFGSLQGSGTVGFKNADDGGATYINPLATQIVSWSNTQIQVKVPSNAGTGTIQVTQGTTATSSGTLTVSWALLNVNFDPGSGTEAYETDHVDDNGSGGYTWQMNANVDGNASERAAFMRAFDSWRCNTGINWTIGSNTSINDAVSDGTNCICNDNAAPLSAGILGVCYSYWNGCASGPTIQWYVNELDIIFDEGSNISPLTWQYGPSLPSSSQYDFESVAVHELGHGHQLAHVIASGQIMHYALSNGASNRTPSANDLAAAANVQSRSTAGNVCGPGAMTNYSCASSLSASGSQTNLTCNSVCNGSATVTASGGTTPYTYSWSPSGGSAATASSLCAGNYTCTVTDNASATVTVTFNITQPSAITLTASSQTNISCNGGSNGAASVNAATGGTGSFTYNWTPGNPTGDGTTSVTGLSVGTYTCTATDANGCSQTRTFSITQPSAITTSGSSTPSSCSGSTGTATTTASGGAGSFTYSWAPSGGTAATATNLAAGSYTCTVTDANNCTATQTVTVGTTSSPTVTLVSETDPLCAGGSDGSALVSASGGTPGYTYSWFPIGGNGTLATGLSAGAYICTVTDAATCTASVIVTVTSPNAVAGSVSQTNVSCNGGSNGSATVTASGGTPGYTYSWSPSGGTAATASGLSAGNYTCTITDSHACTGTATVTITEPTALVVTAGGTASICPSSTTTITAGSSGGTGSVSFNWMPGNLSGSSVVVSPSSTTTYTVTGTDANGCTNSANVTITVITCSTATATVPCGNTYYTKAAIVNASFVSGAVNYKFSFYDNSTGALVTQRIQPTRSLTLSNVPGLYYNTTYKWTVAVDIGSGYGPESNSSCTITLGAPKTTVPCGVSYNNLNSYSAVTAVPGVSNYKFSFYNTSTGALVAQKIQTSNYIYFNQVSGLIYGNTYNWTVACEYLLQSGGHTYGPESNNSCAITFNPPQTIVPCGGTYNRSTGYSAATAVSGAIKYRYTFWQGVTQIAQYVSPNSSAYIYFNQVSGIASNGSYTWTVEVLYNNGTGQVYGPPSNSSCTISFSTSALSVNNNDFASNAIDRIEQSDSTSVPSEALDPSISIYPNPTEDGILHLTLTGFGVESGSAVIQMMDMLGNEVYSTNMEFNDNQEFEFHPEMELSKGVYLLRVSSNGQMKVTRVVVQ